MIKIVKQVVNNISVTLKRDNFSLQKKEVLDLLDSSVSRLKNDVVPMLNDLDKEVGMKSIDTKYLSQLTSSYNNFSKSKVKEAEYLNVIKRVIEKVCSSEQALNNLISSGFKATTTDHTITIKEVAIYNLIKKIEYVSIYAIDIFLLIADAADGKEHTHKLIKERIIKDIGVFNLYLSDLNPDTLDKTIKDLNVNPDFQINRMEEAGDSLGEILDLNKQKISGLANSGFIGNPFYHIRKFFADRDQTTYELNKAKKEQYALLITNLRLKQQGNHDPRIEKEIEAYTKKIIKLEKEIEEYVNG